MTKLEMIQKVINGNFVYENEFLEEKKPDFTMRITLSDKNTENKIIYRFDPDNGAIFPFFSDEKHLNKICDFFVFFERNNKLYVLISELKRGCSSKNSIANKQLDASEHFIDFVIKSANRIGIALKDEDCVIYKLRFSEEYIKKAVKKQSKFKTPLHGCGNNIYEYRSNCIEFIDFR